MVKKTDEHRWQEAKVREFHYEELYADVAPHVLARIESIVSHRDSSGAHVAYGLAHGMGTAMTAVRMRLAVERLGCTPMGNLSAADLRLQAGLQRAHDDIMGTTWREVLNHAADFEVAASVIAAGEFAVGNAVAFRTSVWSLQTHPPLMSAAA